ncbi:MAG: MarR family transcriptional regulator [Candidatus Woesearchaeota archaeon]|nr:MAG: MarR family transcriptional regulator [Candidatus Woesearchaeota archaeon]
MKNKYVGLLVIAIAVLVLFMILSYDIALTKISDSSCLHGATCPMSIAVRTQRNISLGLVSFLMIIGLYILFFFREKETHKETIRIPYEKLDDEEKKIVDLIKAYDNNMYQSDIVKEMGLSKVKVSRILDKLEGKKIIERRRRGMTNVVILK